MNEATFNITGTIERKWAPPSGKVATVRIGLVNARGRTVRHDVKAFTHEMIKAIETAGVGETVTVTGEIERQALKDKSGEDVKVDGFTFWEPSLVVKTFVVAEAKEGPGVGKDEIPF